MEELQCNMDNKDLHRADNNAAFLSNGRGFACGEEGHIRRFCPNVRQTEASVFDGGIAFSMSTKFKNQKENAWFADCGATNHMCHNRNIFINYRELNRPIPIAVGDNRKIIAVGKGDVNIQCRVNGVFGTKL